MFSFEKMIAWQKAAEWSNSIFDIADGLPQRLQFSFGEQLRSACLSVTNNLAEGSGRRTPAMQGNFYDSARGSVFEVVNIAAMLRMRKRLADDLYVNLRAKAEEVSILIYKLIQATHEAEAKSRTLREDDVDYDVGNDAN